MRMGGSVDKEDLGLIPGSEEPLEEEMAPPSGTLAWEISWTEEVAKESDTT